MINQIWIRLNAVTVFREKLDRSNAAISPDGNKRIRISSHTNSASPCDFVIEFSSESSQSKNHWLRRSRSDATRRVINHFDKSTRKRFILSQLSWWVIIHFTYTVRSAHTHIHSHSPRSPHLVRPRTCEMFKARLMAWRNQPPYLFLRRKR